MSFAFFISVINYNILLSGDVSQPIIKIRGNRAYLCKWKAENKIAHSEMKELGMVDSTDLFEVDKNYFYYAFGFIMVRLLINDITMLILLIESFSS